ncbi:hypothetical protein [Natronospira bacteriovora]|uniref:Uncharacterized protein n=1 Tax=Natronospira bacteriovora TaxID=3069753 RepID=A0ABU0W927_9GAMM|nr:hypothetical protein [Natronospira sp. AB-CW4]MDQ2070418.1 hypothetical protein [Natronospira sp. AB-CW4]
MGDTENRTAGNGVTGPMACYRPEPLRPAIKTRILAEIGEIRKKTGMTGDGKG